MATTVAAAQRQQQKLQNFDWKGLNNRGQKVKGELRAPNVVAANAELRRQGIAPTRVVKQKGSLWASLNARPVKPKDIAVFVRQLATMTDAGIPLVQSLDILAGGQSNPTMQKLIEALQLDLESGSSFADALRQHPGHFDDLFANLVEAGEHSGSLEALLKRIANYKERTESIKGKVRKALVYPASVIFVAIVVVAIVMVFVVPQFEEIFQNFGADLPVLTRVVVDISRFFVAQGWIILLSIFAATGIGIFAWKRSSALKRFADKAILTLPIIGTIVHKASIARFARTLATTFAAGLPVVESLDSVAGATGNVVVSNAVLRMRDQMATGQSMVFAMRQEKVFPHMLRQMAAVGEETGQLDEMLNKVADFFEEEVDNMVDALSSLLEPFILVVIGGIVGTLVVALYLPIFNLGHVVG